MSAAIEGFSNDEVMNSRAMRWVYRTVPLVSSVVVAAASFALSFVALRDVAARTEAVPASLAWLVPIVIDGGVMCASAVIWAAAAQGRRRQVFPFVVVFVLVALSVVVNTAHAGPTLLAKLIAALPPLVLLATLELVAITTRSSRGTSPRPPTPIVPNFEPPTTSVPTASSPSNARAFRQATAPAAGDLAADFDAEIEALEAELDGPISGHLAANPTPVAHRATASGRRATRVRADGPAL